jgi:hypothetical protein
MRRVPIGLHVRADAKHVAEGTFRNVTAAVVELESGRFVAVRSRRGTDQPIDRSFPSASGVALIVIEGYRCSLLGQLHPLGISSSELALDALRRSLRARPAPSSGAEPEWLRTIVAESSSRAYGTAMGTLRSSLALALVSGRSAWIAHVGDVVVAVSRRARGYDFVELTADHTMLNDRVARGAPRAELDALRASGFRDVLVRCFGWRPRDCEADVRCADLDDGDVLVLAPRELLRGVAAAPVAAEVRRSDRRAWHQLWFDEARRRKLGAAGLLMAEAT